MMISLKASNQQIFKDVITNFISALSSNMFTYGLGLMLLNQTQSALSFGIELAIGPIISLLCMIPVGNLTDHLPHKIIIIVSMMSRIVFLLALLTTINFFEGVWKFVPIGIFVAVNTVAVVFASTAYSASVHELVNDKKIHQLSSLTSAANSLATIFAPVLGVGLYVTLGFSSFVWTAIVALMMAMLITLTMKFHYNEHVKNSRKERPENHFREGLEYVSQRPLIKILIIIAVGLNFIFSAINIGIPYIINTQLKLGNALIGFLDMFNAIGGFLIAMVMNFWPNNRARILKVLLPLFICSFYFIALGLIFMFIKSVTIIYILGAATMFIGGIGVAMLNITTQINIQETTPTEILGRVTVIMTTACTIVFPIGTLAFTFIFQAISNGAIIYLMAGVFWLIIILLILPKLLNVIQNDIK
jgi:DHA3 family macrolide efflux protein-like MFS transporter